MFNEYDLSFPDFDMNEYVYAVGKISGGGKTSKINFLFLIQFFSHFWNNTLQDCINLNTGVKMERHFLVGIVYLIFLKKRID